MKSTHSPHDGAKIFARDAETPPVSAPAGGDILLYFPLRCGGGGGATVRPHCLGDTTMIFLGILLSIAAIGFFCWLLFTLAVFALPLFAGLSIATWAYHTGAGWLGAILIGIVAGGLTLGIGQVLLAIVRPIWALRSPRSSSRRLSSRVITPSTASLNTPCPRKLGRSSSRSSARLRWASLHSCALRAWRRPSLRTRGWRGLRRSLHR